MAQGLRFKENKGVQHNDFDIVNLLNNKVITYLIFLYPSKTKTYFHVNDEVVFCFKF